jgi:hypothetical protein
MIYSRCFAPFCKVCALAGAILILPVLAYAGHDQGKKGDNDDNKGNKGKGSDKHVPAVPETNAAWVLVPFFGAVLLFSSRRFFSANLAKN